MKIPVKKTYFRERFRKKSTACFGQKKSRKIRNYGFKKRKIKAREENGESGRKGRKGYLPWQESSFTSYFLILTKRRVFVL